VAAVLDCHSANSRTGHTTGVVDAAGSKSRQCRASVTCAVKGRKSSGKPRAERMLQVEQPPGHGGWRDPGHARAAKAAQLVERHIEAAAVHKRADRLQSGYALARHVADECQRQVNRVLGGGATPGRCGDLRREVRQRRAHVGRGGQCEEHA
jgi:hypothetical protein